MGAQGRIKKLLYNLNTDVGILGKELSNLKKEIKMRRWIFENSVEEMPNTLCSDEYYNNVVVCADIVVRFMTRLVIQVPDRRLRPALTALKELLKVKLGIPIKKNRF